MFKSKLFSLSFKVIKKLNFTRTYRTQYNYNMNFAYFRHLPTTSNQSSASPVSQIQISFHYENSELSIDRDFNFCRNFNEIIDVFLDRIKNNIEKELIKKMKKKKSKKSKNNSDDNNEKEEDKMLPMITVEMLKGNDVVHNVSFEELLREEDVHTNLILRVLKNDFIVKYNLPWVINLSLPTSILAGFILYPCKLELQHAERDLSSGTWYRGVMPKSNDTKQIEWHKIHDGLTYTTQNDDIDHHIKFELIPRNSNVFGPTAECVSKNQVQAGPGLCPFENRHKFTTNHLTDNEFRVISYNILADLYADSDYTRKELFPYCPPYALNIDYRKQLLLKEIVGYNGDIICLQEVDGKIFDFDLLPLLDIAGYSGLYKQKGKAGEGLATFYYKERFKFIQDYSFIIGESLDKFEIFHDIWVKIKNNEKLIERIINKSTTLQINLVKSLDTGNLLLIANTHLYFHPDADHIRLLQFGLCMIYLEDLYKTITKTNLDSGKTLSLIFCGDFNSTPECGVYKLMLEKYVDENFIDWRSNETEAVKEVSLSQPFDIESACGCPKYTNYTVDFNGCLDYIFYQTSNLEVKEVIPFPSDEEIKTHIAIPSVVVPSDHIALVADLKFR